MYKSYKKNGKLWTLGAFELPITDWLKKKFPVQSEVTLDLVTWDLAHRYFVSKSCRVSKNDFNVKLYSRPTQSNYTT